MAAAFGREKPADQDWRAFFLEVDPRWVEPAWWERLAKAIEVPSERIEVVYLYRNVTNGGPLEYRELARGDSTVRCGDVALRNCLEPEVLARIFRR